MLLGQLGNGNSRDGGAAPKIATAANGLNVKRLVVVAVVVLHGGGAAIRTRKLTSRPQHAFPLGLGHSRAGFSLASSELHVLNMLCSAGLAAPTVPSWRDIAGYADAHRAAAWLDDE